MQEDDIEVNRGLGTATWVIVVREGVRGRETGCLSVPSVTASAGFRRKACPQPPTVGV